MLDPRAYRRHILARFLRIAGAGSASVAAISATDCGADVRTSQAGATSGGGHGGASSASTAASTGDGSGGSGGVIMLTTSATSTTVGVGGAPDDGGITTGKACITSPDGGVCPTGSAATDAINGAIMWSECMQVVDIVSGPTLDGGLCCYEVETKPFPCYVGRTFFVDEGIVKAPLRRGGDWRAGAAPDVSRLPAATRRALAEAWARDGLFEHASVASFARFAMQLLALGAPADLVRDTHAAAVDEVRHAELCLGLASVYHGDPLEPAALPVSAPLAIVPDLPAIAAEAVMEGCIGETVATVQALDALAEATDPAVRAVLEETVADETRHAELAWRFVAWALDAGGETTRDAVLEAFMGFRPPEPRVEALDDVDLALYAAHGRQRAVEGRAIAERAMADIVRPVMCALLSRRRAPAARADGGAAVALAV